jgi:hypothetical protein
MAETPICEGKKWAYTAAGSDLGIPKAVAAQKATKPSVIE